jgi:hypothetical protein
MGAGFRKAVAGHTVVGPACGNPSRLARPPHPE